MVSTSDFTYLINLKIFFWLGHLGLSLSNSIDTYRLTSSFRAWDTTLLVLPPFINMACLSFSTIFGSRFSRKRLPCCVLGFLQENPAFRIFKTILIFLITIIIPFTNKLMYFDYIIVWVNIDYNVLHVTLVHVVLKHVKRSIKKNIRPLLPDYEKIKRNVILHYSL